MSDAADRFVEEILRRFEVPRVELRIGEVTQVEDTGDHRARLTISGNDHWAATDSETALRPGDRVYALKQGTTWVVAGKLSGGLGGPPPGAVTAYAGQSTSIPDGWLLCDGQAVSRTEHPGLFAAVGTTYGSGNGTSTFNVPNLTGRFPLGDNSARALGDTGGDERVTLTTAQMPSHTHTVSGAAGSQTVQSGTGASVANTTDDTTTSAGGGDSHNNMPPYLVLHFIVKGG